MGFSLATTIASIVSAAVSAYATYSTAQAQAETFKYQKKVAENQAVAARQAAQVAEEQQQEHDRRELAAQRAQLGGQGVTEEGSPLLVMLESAYQSSLASARIRYGGEIQATGREAEGRLAGFEARATRRAGTIGAGVTLLNSAASVGWRYAGKNPGGDGSSSPGYEYRPY